MVGIAVRCVPVILCCVGRDLVMSRSPIQRDLPKYLKVFIVSEVNSDFGMDHRGYSITHTRTNTTFDDCHALSLSLYEVSCPK